MKARYTDRSQTGVVLHLEDGENWSIFQGPGQAGLTPEMAAAFIAFAQANGIAIEAASDMPVIRREAFTRAMDFGNQLTQQIIGQYSDVEARSWAVQEAEARAVIAGQALGPTAILPPLASDKGVTLAEYAASVVENADYFRAIAVAGVKLRRAAEMLLSDEIDTPEKLDALFDQLKTKAIEAATQLGIPLP